ncbi:P-loop containing nucleoside triphosphate hydrolase protein [Backusella circina FSU 941]|nr:P-loop containing nucleoside triphosphate hydrolase protein [Backusella circina FSU 941]
MAPKSLSHKQPNLKSHFITVKTEEQDVIPLSFPKLTSKPPFSPHQPPQLYTGERYLTQRQDAVLPLNRKEPPDFFPLLINDVYAKVREQRKRYKRQFPTKQTTIKQTMDCINPFWQSSKPCKYLFHNLPTDDSVLWTEKYRPKRTEGLFQNGIKVLGWLESSKLGQQCSKSRLYLLVGPSGTGKSATVQTAAQEAGYEIFESNPTTKRSGRDLLQQLGEVTSSHLVGFDNVDRVNRKRKNAKTIILKDSVVLKNKKKKKIPILPGHNDMMHYFQKVTVHDEEMEVDQVEIQQQVIEENQQDDSNEEEEMDDDDDIPSLQPPKQSLVLLEEVDILFEDDKGFWSAVKELSEKSKRPIIMTCNDMSKIPLDMLNIEQIIHFKAPDRQILTSYLSLICLAEGFIIPISDLSRLVQLYNCDTRRLIHTLQFWCKREKRQKQDEFYVYEGFYKEVITSGEANSIKKEENDQLDLMYANIQAACSIDTWVAQEDRLEQHFNAIDQYYPNDIVVQSVHSFLS